MNTRVWTFPRRGFVLQPRVAVLGYAGKDGAEFPNPDGVVAQPLGAHRPPDQIALNEFIGPFTWDTATTPLGLRGSSLLFPKVAEYSNLGLWAATTSWLTTRALVGFGERFPSSDRFSSPKVQARNRLPEPLRRYSHLSALSGSVAAALRAGR